MGRKDGKGVDASGGPVVDPTANVIALSEASSKRQDDLRAASEKYVESEIRHLADMASLRDEHSKELREAEASRLNAINQANALAVTTAAERTLTAVQTLATQTAATIQGMNERISALEKSSYEGAGKQRIIDPQMEELVREVHSLSGSQSQGVGKSQGLSNVWAAVLGAVALLGLLISGYSALNKPAAVIQPPVQITSPQKP